MSRYLHVTKLEGKVYFMNFLGKEKCIFKIPQKALLNLIINLGVDLLILLSSFKKQSFLKSESHSQNPTITF
jgi:hypothetical protein